MWGQADAATSLSGFPDATLLARLKEEYQGVFDADHLRLHIQEYLGLTAAEAEFATVRSLLPGPRILDIGCGYGSFVLVLRSSGLDAVGVDAAENDIAEARRRLPDGVPANDVFVHGDALKLPFPAASFDAVTMWNSLEHIPDARRAITEAVRVLRPGGLLAILAPNYAAFRREAHYDVAWLPLLPRRIARRYLKARGRNPRYFDESIHYVTWSGVGRILRDLGLEPQDLRKQKIVNASTIRNGFRQRLVSIASRPGLREVLGAYLSATFRWPFKATIEVYAFKRGP